MAVNQDIVDALVVLDNTVQAQIAEATLTKEAADALVLAFNSTKDYVETQLNNVDNTSDADKALSILSIAKFLTKQDSLVDGVNISTINGSSLLSGAPLVIERGQVEVPVLDYDNRASLRTPANTASIPLPGSVVNIQHLGHFQYSIEDKFLEDDETVFVTTFENVVRGQWVMMTPAYEWTEANKMFEVAVLNEYMEDEEIRHDSYNNKVDEVPHQ